MQFGPFSANCRPGKFGSFPGFPKGGGEGYIFISRRERNKYIHPSIPQKSKNSPATPAAVAAVALAESLYQMPIHQVFADRLALLRWADTKMEDASVNVQRFVAAVADMNYREREKFFAVAFLYGGSLSDILPALEQDEHLLPTEEPPDA